MGTGVQSPLGSAGAAAVALSKLFEGNDEEDGHAPGMGPSFKPTTELPELFRYAERLHEMRSTGENAGTVDLPIEFRSIAGVAIIRDAAGMRVRRNESSRRR